MSRQSDKHASEPQGTVVVACESQKGRAGTVAEAARDAARAKGYGATIGVIDDLASSTIASADALIAGCWMPGKAPFGDEPMQRMISWMPRTGTVDAR